MARFQKGQSGNPGGRPKLDAEVLRLCQDSSLEAVQTLVKIMKDPRAGKAYRIRSAEIILERGFGKPIQPSKPVSDETYEAFLSRVMAPSKDA